MKLIFLVISLLIASGYVGSAPRPQDYNIYRTGSFYPNYIYNHPSVYFHSYPISSVQSANAPSRKTVNVSSNVNTDSSQHNQDNVDIDYSSLFSSDSSSKNGNVSPSDGIKYNNNNNNNNNNSDVNYSFGNFGASQNWKSSAPSTGFGFPFAPNGGSFGNILDYVTVSSLNSAASPLNHPLFNADALIAISRVAASAQSLNEPSKPEEKFKIKVIGDTSRGTINIINPFITGKSNGVNFNNESSDARRDNIPDDDFLKKISPFRTGVDPVFGPEIAPKYEIHYTPENWSSDMVPPLLPFHPDLFAGPGYVLLHNASLSTVSQPITPSSISSESTPALQSYSPKSRIEINEESSSEFSGAPASIDSLFKSKDESNAHSETSSDSFINSTNSTDGSLSGLTSRDRKSSTLNRKKKSFQVRRDKTKSAVDSKKFKKSSVTSNSEIRSSVLGGQKSILNGNDVKKSQIKPESIRKQRM